MRSHLAAAGALALCAFLALVDAQLPASAPQTLSNAQVAIFGGGNMAAGNLHGCGIRSDGMGFCWGLAGPWIGIGIPMRTTWDATQNVGAGACSCTPYSVNANQPNKNTNGIGPDITAGATGRRVLQFSIGVFTYNTNTATADTEAATGNTMSGTSYGAYQAYTLALLSDGSAVAFGVCNFGQCGGGTLSSPFLVDNPATNTGAAVQYDGSGSGVKIVQLSAGPKHSCYLLSTGQVRCTGSMSNSEAGISGLTATLWTASHADHDFSTLRTTLAAPYNSWTLKVVQVAVGGGFTCFLMNTGHVTCFGINTDGQCGRGNKNAAPLPTVAVALTTSAVHICAGRGYACALGTDGGIDCWGDSSERAFAPGFSSPYPSPQAVTLTTGATALTMSCGWAHMCYMRASDRAVICGGEYNNNQLFRSGVANNNAQPNTGTTAWNYGGQAGYVANSIGLGASAIASCAMYTRTSTGRREIACAGLNYACGAGTADTNANANTITQLSALSPVLLTSGTSNTMDAGIPYSSFPVVQVLGPGTGIYTPNATHTFIQVTAWVPFDRSATGGGTGAMAVYMDNMPCVATIQTSATTFVCQVDAALLSQVRAPPQVSLSWTGAPLGFLHSLYDCPRPLTDALVVTNLDTMAPGSITVTGLCFGSQNYPWNAFAQTLSATILSGRRSGTISAATATSITVALPTGAGSSVLTITNPAATIPTAPANILITYRAPTITSVVGSRPTGFLAPRGETITINGRYFGPPGVGIVVVVKLGTATLSATVVSDSVITATVPAFSGNLTLALVVTVEDQDTDGVRLTYQQPVVTGVSPAQYYSTTSLASKSFSIIGTGFGTSTADVAYASIGGVNCTSVALVSSTNVTCTLTAAAMTGFSTSYVALVAARMLTFAGNASIFTPLGLPVIRRVVTKQGDPTSAIWLDGASLGYGTPATRTFSGITAGPLAPVVNSIGIYSTMGGAIPCSTRYYPATLGNGFLCYLDTTQANLTNGFTFVPYIVLEDGVVISNPTSLSFAVQPIITSVTTTRGSNLISPAGSDVITVAGQNFGRTGALLVSTVYLNGVPTSFIAASTSSFTVTAPAYSSSLTVNLTVVVNGLSSAPAILTYDQPSISSIAPAQTYTTLGPGVVSKWFLITGNGFGMSSGDINAVRVGGVACSSWVRLSRTQINCTMTTAAIGTMNSPAVSVTLTGLVAFPAVANIFSLLGTPTLTRFLTKSPADFAAPIAVDGLSLGYGAAKQQLISSTSPGNNLPVIVGYGLYDPVNRTLLKCDTSNYPITLGTGFVCLPSVNIVTNVPYKLMVQLEDNITVSSTNSITYTTSALKLVVTWLTQDLEASALPSSSNAMFPISPRIRVQAKTDTGANPVSAVTCMLVLDPSSLPTATSIFSLLVGNFSQTADATGLTTFNAGIVGQSNWNYTLNAQCSYNSGGPAFYAATSIRVRVLPLQLQWNVQPPNGTALSAQPSKSLPAGLLAPIVPSPTLSIVARNGSSLQAINMSTAITTSVPSASCSLTASTPTAGEFVQTMGTSTVTATTGTNQATFPSIGVVGSLFVPYQLMAACTWPTSEIITSTSNLAQIVSLRVSWTTAPPASFIYNTATTGAVALVSQLDVTTGNWIPLPSAGVQASDLSCTLTATITGSSTPVTFLGGSIGSLTTNNSSFTISPLFMLPVYFSTTGPISVDLTLQCLFRGQTIAPITRTTVMQTLTMAWNSAPTSVMGSSSSKNIFLPSLDFSLLDATPAVLTSDSSTSCSLDVSNAVTVTGADARIIVDGTTSITLSSGRGVFNSWFIAGPLQSMATLRVTCSRQQGGPTVTLYRNVTLHGAQVDLFNTTSIAPSYGRTLVVFDMPAPIYARVNVRNITSNSDPTQYMLRTYSSTTAPASSCDLLVHASVPPAANAFLSGDPTTYQGMSTDSVGWISFSVRLSASPNYAIPLVLSCSFGDSVITSTVFYFEVADVAPVWITRPPALFAFNTLTTAMLVGFNAIVPANATAGTSASYQALKVGSGDMSCNVAAALVVDGSAVSFTGATPSSFNTTGSSVSFSGIALSPATPGRGDNVTVSIDCVLRGAMTVASISSVTQEQQLSLAWGVSPPANFTASTSAATYNLRSISVKLLDGAGAVLASDSTTLCSLSIASAQTAAGVAITTATVSGTTQAILSAGIATFPTWSVTTMIDSIATLKVTCRRKQGGADITIAADMAARGAEIHWFNSTTLTQSYGIPIFLYDNTYTMMARLNPHIPTNTTLFPTTVKVAYDTTQYPAAACSMSVDASAPAAANAYLTGDPSVYNGQRVAADGFVAFSVRLSAEPEMPVPLVLTCTYGDNTISSELMYVQIARLSISWAAVPPTLFTFNTPTPASSVSLSVIIPGNDTAGTNATVLTAAAANVVPADISCDSEVYDVFGGTVPYTGGSPGTMNAGTGIVAITGFAIAPSSASPGYRARITVSCTFRKYMAIPLVEFNSTLQELYLSWIVTPAVAAMPSTSTQQFLLPDVSLALYNSTGGALVADYTSLCSISVLSATDATGLLSVQAATVGNTKATAVAGIVTFTGWGINAPFGSLITVLASCTRVERGPDLTATGHVAMYNVAARWSSFSSIADSDIASTPTLLYDTAATALGSVVFMRPTNATDPSQFVWQAYNSSTSPTATCSLAVDTSATVPVTINGQSSLYQAVAVNASGFVPLAFRLAAQSATALPLQLQCQVGDALVGSPIGNVAIAPLSMAFVENRVANGHLFPPLPATFTFNELLPQVDFEFVVTAMNATGSTQLSIPASAVATTADFVCSASASTSASGTVRSVPIPGGVFSGFAADNSSMSFYGAFPQPPYSGVTGAVDCTLSLQCSFRGQSAAPITLTSYMLNTSLAFDVMPPETAPRTIASTASTRAAWLDPFTVAMHMQDGSYNDAASQCTVTSTGGVDVNGIAIAARSIIVGGSTSVSMTGGQATFSSWWIDAPLSSTIVLLVVCRPADGSPAATVETTVAMEGAQVAIAHLDTLDPTNATATWFYDTPMNVSAYLQSRTPTTRANGTVFIVSEFNHTALGSSVACSLAIDSASVLPGATAALGGDARQYQSQLLDAFGFVTFSVRPQAAAGGFIPLKVTCVLGDATLDPVFMTVAISGITVRMLDAWPELALPSSRDRFVPIAPSLRAAVYDVFNQLVTDDAGAACVLTAAPIAALTENRTWALLSQSEAVARPLALAGPSVASSGVRLLAGVASFDAVAVLVQAGTLVQFKVQCQRSQGGSVDVLYANTSIAAFSVQWRNGSEPPARVLYNTPYALAAQLLVQNNTDTGDAMAFVPYEPSLYADASCTLKIADADISAGLTLSGGSRATNNHAAAGGYLAFTLQIQRAPTYTTDSAHVTIDCNVLGSVASTTPPLVSTVQHLQASFAVAPPDRSWPSSGSMAFNVVPPPLVRVVSTEGEAVDNAGVTCAVTVSRTVAPVTDGSALASVWFSRIWDPPEGDYNYVHALDGILLDTVKLSAWWNTQAVLDIQCVRPQGDAILPVSFPLRIAFVGVSWSSLPPIAVDAAQPIPMNISIEDGDYGGRNVNDSGTICSVSNTDGMPMRQQIAQASRGVVNWDRMQLVGRVGSRYTMVVTCKYGDIPYPFTLEAPIDINGCLIGDAPTADFTGCSPCGDGSYSEGGVTSCIKCPFGVQCLEGVLSIQEGYFLALPPEARTNPAKYNVTFLEGGRVIATITPTTELHTCWTPDSCVVNATERSFGCAQGYTGVLCGVCDENNGWVRQSNHCIKCLNPGLDFFILFAGGLAITMALVFVSLVMDFGNPSDAKTVWRILVNYLSAVGAFSTYVAKGTETFLTSFNIFQSVLSPGSGSGLEVSPIQCQLKLGFYTKFTATIFLPVICASICILINVLNIARYKGPQGLKAFWTELKAFWTSQKAVAVAALVMFMAYPSVTAKAFTMFQCMSTTIAGVHYLALDLSVSCDTTTHAMATTLSWVVIGLLCAGLPILFAWWLIRNEDKVKLGVRSQFFGTFGFLFQGYKTDKPIYYVWEALVMVRKAFIVSIAATTKDPVYQCCSAMLLLIVSLGLQLHVAPFAKPLFNFLEAMTLFALVATMAVSMMYLRSTQVVQGTLSTLTPSVSSLEGQAQAKESSGVLNEKTTSALLLIVNMVTVLALVYMFISIKRSEIVRNTTCAEQCMDCFDFGKRRRKHDFVMQELSNRLLPVDGALVKKASSRRILPIAPTGRPDRRVINNPLATTDAKKRLYGLAVGDADSRPAPPPPKPRRLKSAKDIRADLDRDAAERASGRVASPAAEAAKTSVRRPVGAPLSQIPTSLRTGTPSSVLPTGRAVAPTSFAPTSTATATGDGGLRGMFGFNNKKTAVHGGGVSPTDSADAAFSHSNPLSKRATPKA